MQNVPDVKDPIYESGENPIKKGKVYESAESFGGKNKFRGRT